MFIDHFNNVNSDTKDNFRLTSYVQCVTQCVCILLCTSFIGCVSVPKNTVQETPFDAELETNEDVISALEQVAGSLSGQDVDGRELIKDLRKDPEAQSALESITGAMSGDNQPVVIKYSPVTGKHFSAEVMVCPDSGVPLEILEIE